MTKIHAPFGYWPSSLTSKQLAAGSLKLGAPNFWCDGIVWLESVPSEKGRMTLMYSKDGRVENILPAPWDVRSKTHEYGGGAYTVGQDAIYFVNAADQNIYAVSLGSAPVAITRNSHCRYADLKIGEDGWLYAICERFGQPYEDPQGSIVAINTQSGEIVNLAEGEDFYAGLTLASSNTKIAYVSWNHPNMPWDQTALTELTWTPGSPDTIIRTQHNGSAQESILQPEFSPSGVLHYVSDRNDWWNIFCAQDNQPVFELEAEFATPQWTFGMKNWGFLNERTLFVSYSQNGEWSIATIDLKTRVPNTINSALNVISDVSCQDGKAVFLGASSTTSSAPHIFNGTEVVSLKPDKPVLPKNEISAPQNMAFSIQDQSTIQLFYYPPYNSQYQDTKSTKPPLIVIGHGGPTGATDASLNLKIQYWTQRGFAVADINYRGSTGFGREFRNSLKGAWGLKDVEDLCAAADYLVAQGLAHPQQKIIKGSSAGGYSVLAALTMHETFNAGVSLYGIADLHALASDTHKFEAKYLEGLIGKYPDEAEEYTRRSPINHISRLHCPILVAQGLDDKVVPPAQAELIVKAAEENGMPVVYLPFKGEGHGFRSPQTLDTLFTEEHCFYQEQLLSKTEPNLL